MPKAIDEQKEKEEVLALVKQEKEVGHKDDDCPNVTTISKLKGEIKRLRQDLIMKGPSKKQKAQAYDSEDDDSFETELDEDEKSALKMLSPE